MQQIYLITLCFLLKLTNLMAQVPAKDFTVRFQHGPELFSENFAAAASTKATNAECINGRFQRWVQFESVLSVDEQRNLTAKGVEIISYVHFGAYLLSFPQQYNLAELGTMRARSIMAPQAHWKMHRNLIERPLGEWAVKGDLVKVELQLLPIVTLEEAAAHFAEHGWSVLKKSNTNPYLQVLLPQVALHELANWPGTLWMELLSPPAEKEDLNGRSLHRANQLDSEHPLGKKYNGEGIATLVRDDGAVGPHIDFEGRLFNQEDVGPPLDGTHGDGVAGIIGAAGNIDPTKKGMAIGADVYVVDYESDFEDQTLWLHLNKNVTVTNSSYSDGCNAGYTFASYNVDDQIFNHPTLMHVFSAGNSNGSDCDYGAGNQWGNITGGHKMGKNAIATANLLADGTLSNSSSRGPAHDGRLKPDIAAHGAGQNSTDPDNLYQEFGGTSAAAPGIAGCMAQLMHAYKNLNNGAEAPTALLKLAMLITANDLGNPGPDFRFGWGHINNYRALGILENSQYATNTVQQGATQQFSIEIPANVAEARLMLYWADPAATPSAATALVNDLDLRVFGPSNTISLPLVLDPTPNANSLNANAVPGEDHLNNMEQVRLTAPMPGTYTFNVEGFEVPMGPQTYYLAWEFISADPVMVYPAGGESFTPGANEWLRWDAYGNSGTFQLQYSVNNGNTWINISGANNLVGTSRSFEWTVPNVTSAKARVRVTRSSGTSAQSEFPLAIAPIPQNVGIDRVCPDSITIGWTALSDTSLNYDVFILGEKYMELKGSTSSNHLTLPISNATLPIWAAVRSSREDTLAGRRSIAINWPGGLKACPQPFDASLDNWLSPGGNAIVTCGANSLPVVIRVSNQGINPMVNATASYQLNNNTVVTENLPIVVPGAILEYTFSQPLNFTQNTQVVLRSWVSQSGETYRANDTLVQNFPVVTELLGNNFVETFEASTLPVGWNIENPDESFTWERSSIPNGVDGTPTHAMELNHFSYGDYGQQDYLYLPPVNLSAFDAPGLLFSYSHAQFSGYFDSLRIEAFPGCDFNADPIILWEAGDPDYAVTVSSVPFLPQSASDWRTELIDLSGINSDRALIRFTSLNGYGNLAYLDNIGIQPFQSSIPVAEFSAPDTICRTETLVFEAPSNVLSNYNWSFGSLSQPTSAVGPGPHTVTFPVTGTRTIRLIVSNTFGADTALHVLRILGQPTANFTQTVNNATVSFTNTSMNALNYFWNFGDGNISTLPNPTHQYAAAGTYTVKLTSNNQCGSVEKTTVIVLTSSTIESLGFQRAEVLPNPNNGQFSLLLEHTEGSMTAQISVVDMAGRVVLARPTQTFSSGVNLVPFEGQTLAAGQYQLRISTDKGSASLTVLVQ
jgi:PKD repeat protein